MRKEFALASILVLSCPALASLHRSLGQDPSQFDAEIEAAQARHDVAFLNDVLAPDVQFTHGTGTVWNKQQWLQIIQANLGPVTRKLGSLEVETHGDVVETFGQVHVTSNREVRMPSGGTSREYDVWYVRLYARRHSQWLLVSNRTVREEPTESPH